ncbi:MAG: hypothetical protein ACI9QQ_002491, partial [Myxococcota bacterium]
MCGQQRPQYINRKAAALTCRFPASAMRVFDALILGPAKDPGAHEGQ